MILFRKNKEWESFHVSADLKKMDKLESIIEEVAKKSKKSNGKMIDIVDVNIISTVYQPTKNTTFVELMVFVAFVDIDKNK